MLRFLKNAIASKPKSASDLYAWKYLEFDELDQIPNGIDDIYNQKYVGIIVRNVFSAQEVEQMRKGIESMDTQKMVSTGVGYSYPKIFAQLVKPHDKTEVKREDLKNYFNYCSNLPQEIQEIFGLDFQERIESVFRKINSNRAVEVVDGIDGEGKYAFTSIRINLPNQGFIPVHCGNYFQQEFPMFYDHLKTQVQIKDQLSYFVTVNPAEIGGELSLFDLKWEAGQKKENTADDRGVTPPSGKFIDLGENSKVRRQKVKPAAGDLLLFSGGPVWHKVELVKGNESRITVGGFLALTESADKLKYWT